MGNRPWRLMSHKLANVMNMWKGYGNTTILLFPLNGIKVWWLFYVDTILYTSIYQAILWGKAFIFHNSNRITWNRIYLRKCGQRTISHPVTTLHNGLIVATLYLVILRNARGEEQQVIIEHENKSSLLFTSTREKFTSQLDCIRETVQITWFTHKRLNRVQREGRWASRVTREKTESKIRIHPHQHNHATIWILYYRNSANYMECTKKP